MQPGPGPYAREGRIGWIWWTPLSYCLEKSSPKEFRKNFFWGDMEGSPAPAARQGMLSAHQRRALGTLHGGLGRAHFSSTLARPFSRGSLLPPVERVSLRCFTLDLNKWEKASASWTVLSLISSFFCGPRTNSCCHVMAFIRTVFFLSVYPLQEANGSQ